MIGADLVRAVVLVPVAIAGLTGGLPLWGLVVASFVLEAATSYFAPAYGATSQRSSTARTSSRRTRSCRRQRRRSRSAAGRSPPHCSPSCRSASSSPSTRLVLRLGRSDRRHPTRGASTTPHASRPRSAKASRRCARTPCSPRRGRARRRGHDHRRHMDRRRTDARARHAPPRRRRLLDRHGRLRGRIDRGRRRPRACSPIRRKARAACSRGHVPARLRAARIRGVAPARSRRRVLRRNRPELVGRAVNSAAQEQVPDLSSGACWASSR